MPKLGDLEMKRFKNILYVADSSGVVLNAFHHAVGLAERNNARLTVIFVVKKIPSYRSQVKQQALRQIVIKKLEASLERLIDWAAGRVDIEGKIVEGKPFLEIIREVLRNGRDLVIKPTWSEDNISTWLFGTNDMHLLRKCPCPVWLIKSTEHIEIRRILAAIDFADDDEPGPDVVEPLNRKIMELAGSLAFIERSEFHIVHAWTVVGEDIMRSARTGFSKEEINSYIDEVRQQNHSSLNRLLNKTRKWMSSRTYDTIAPIEHVLKGNACQIIPTLARKLNIDLIVMGTVANTGISGVLIGNTAETILHQIDCSVLAVKPPGFVTPVVLEE